MRIAKTFNARNPQQRRDLAALLRDRTRDLPRPSEPARDRQPSAGRPRDRAAARLRSASIPATRARTARTTPGGPSATSSSSARPTTLRRRIDQRTNTIARQFDRVCEVLEELDYLIGDEVTTAGAALARHLQRARPGRGRVPAPGDLGRARGCRSWRRCCRRWCSSRATPTTPSAPRVPGGAGADRCSRRWCTIWADLDRSSASTG